jgi:hypothetical protein
VLHVRPAWHRDAICRSVSTIAAGVCGEIQLEAVQVPELCQLLQGLLAAVLLLLAADAGL